MRKAKKPESSNTSSFERRNWGNLFNSLVLMVRKQQYQLETFSIQQKFLEDRLQMQHERWTNDVRFYKDRISQVKGFLVIEEKKQLLQAAKSELMLSLKNRDYSISKWVLDSTKDELEDFKAWFEYHSHKSSNGEDQGTVVKDTGKKKKKGTSSKSAEKENCSDEITDELGRLKGEYEKLALEKDSEVLALLAEKKFVWNQLEIKQDEVEKANKKIKVLVSSMEQLQSEKSKKDSRISELENKVADLEAGTQRLNNEISGLSVELESLRKSRNNQVTPVLMPCTKGASTLEIIKSTRSGRNVTVNKGKEICTPDVHSPPKSSERGIKFLKRKEAPVIPTTETPKLFSSSFKVPKLKPSLRTR